MYECLFGSHDIIFSKRLAFLPVPTRDYGFRIFVAPILLALCVPNQPFLPFLLLFEGLLFLFRICQLLPSFRIRLLRIFLTLALALALSLHFFPLWTRARLVLVAF